MVYVLQVLIVLIAAAGIAFIAAFILSRYEDQIVKFINRFDAWAKKVSDGKRRLGR